MKKQESKHSKTYIWYLTALSLIVSAALMVTVTYARYMAVYNSVGELSLKYDYSNTGVYLLADAVDESGESLNTPMLNELGNAYEPIGNWTSSAESNDEYKLSFLLSNENAPDSPTSFDQSVYLQIFVTEGVASSDDISISLECEGKIYTATGSAVMQGTSMYASYGSGWIYKFYDNDKEENWFLNGGVSLLVPMTLTVSGSAQEVAAVTLIASSKPI